MTNYISNAVHIRRHRMRSSANDEILRARKKGFDASAKKRDTHVRLKHHICFLFVTNKQTNKHLFGCLEKLVAQRVAAAISSRASEWLMPDFAYTGCLFTFAKLAKSILYNIMCVFVSVCCVRYSRFCAWSVCECRRVIGMFVFYNIF